MTDRVLMILASTFDRLRPIDYNKGVLAVHEV